MRILFQVLIILIFSAAGEILHWLIPLPVPASVYGLALLFLCLLTGTVKLSQIEETADFLLQIMPALFVAAAVGLMSIAGLIWDSLLPLLLIVTASTVAVMGVTGRTAQRMIRKREERQGASDE